MKDDPVRLLEEAVFAPELWPQALEALSRAYNARIVSLMREGASGLELLAPPDAEDALSSYVREQWYDKDLRSQRGLRYPQELSFMTDDVLLTKAEQNGLFYRDFAARYDVPHCVAWRFSHNNESYAWTFMRSKKAGPAGELESQRLRPLVSRATAAAVLASKAAQVRASGIIDGLGASGTAALALAADGKVLGVTRQAEALFCQDFDVRDRRVFLSDAAGARAMHALESALTAQSIDAQVRGFAFDSSKGRVVALPSLLSPMAMGFFSRMRALLILKPLRLQHACDPELLRLAFGLTRAEAEVAACVGAGMTGREIAQTRRSSIETVRSFIKTILQKAGLRRQAELAALVNSLSS